MMIQAKLGAQRFETSNFNLGQCFFGEHLLSNDLGKTVAIASGYFAEMGYTWLAWGGLHMVKPERCAILKGRQIVLFPDTGLPKIPDGKSPFEKWSAVANDLQKEGFRVMVSDLLEQRVSTTEKQNELDLADYLLRFKPYDFQRPHMPSENMPFEANAV